MHYNENIRSRVGGVCDVGLVARQIDYRRVRRSRASCCDRETESRLVPLTVSLPLPPSVVANADGRMFI